MEQQKLQKFFMQETKNFLISVKSCKKADFQIVSCFMFEQIVVFHKADRHNVYNVYYIKISSMCIFKKIKKQFGIGFIVDALFGNFAYIST